MRHRRNRRRTAAMVAVTMVGAGGVLAGPGAARAAETPRRFSATSTHDAAAGKSVRVDCPGLSTVFTAGAEVVGGDGGGVMLTEMAPDPTLRFVTVSATARSGYQGRWSLRAYAVCDRFAVAPRLVQATTHAVAAATVGCPGRTRLYGTGFRLQGDVDHNHVDGVVFDEALTELTVHAGGAGTPTSVTALAICKEPVDPGVALPARSAVDANWPKRVSVGDPSFGHRISGVGGQVRGSGRFHLTALVPDTEQNMVRVAADRVADLAAAGGADAGRSAGGDDDEGSLTASVAMFH